MPCQIRHAPPIRFPAPVAGRFIWALLLLLPAWAQADSTTDHLATAQPPSLEALQAPVAKADPHVTEIHGQTLMDPYFWLRERDNPEVIAYLEAENAYTEAQTSHTETLQKTLYDEMLGRIQETDLSVPVRMDDYFYYTRTEEGKQYPLYCRKKGSLEAPEEVVLDSNAQAEGHDFFRVGLYEVSPNHGLLAYSEDTDGSEVYALRVKDLTTGERLTDKLPEVGYGFAWGNDNKTFFYTTQDAAHRQDKVLRHVLGTDPSADEVVFHEPDERFRGVSRYATSRPALST